MHSKYAIFGHPLHPMLVTIPIGLFIWAFVSDVVYVARDHDAPWYDISFWTGIAAWVTGLIAALPGFGDYMARARHSSAANIATAHMTLNLIVVAAYLVAMLLQLDSGATSGGQLGAVFVLHLAGTSLLLLSGWLGGEMVYRHHLGVIPDDATAAQDERARHEIPQPGTQRPAGQNR